MKSWRAASMVLGAAAGVLLHSEARGVGVPQQDPLFYTGVLEDGSGPLTGDRDLVVRFFDAANGGTERCATSARVNLAAGRFRIALDLACVQAIAESPELWAEVFVNTESTGRAKLGAVPY